MSRERIFRDIHDGVAFLRMLERTVVSFEWICLGYCLMPNHFHFLVETPKATLGNGMRHLCGSYAQRFNTRYEHVGHVFQGRYCNVLLERDEHLVELTRYIALNPVRAGICARPEDWPWSSYRATIGAEPAPPWLATELLHRIFAHSPALGATFYRDFVEAAVARDQVPGRASSGHVQGPGPGPRTF